MTILPVEQSTSRALEMADSISVLEIGKKVWQPPPKRPGFPAA